MYYHAAPGGGSVCYLAPEVLRGDDPHIATSADMWSLGAIITYIANDGKHLFRTVQDVLKWNDGKWQNFKNQVWHESPMKRQFKYPELHTLVLSLLSVDKHKRPTAEQVLKDCRDHPERRNRN